ncbi:MAG: hypothetical protein U0U46_03895 [Saprospiraceae bacterium]
MEYISNSFKQIAVLLSLAISLWCCSCGNAVFPTVQIPINDPTPPSVRWYVTDENGSTEYTSSASSIKIKKGTHYGIGLYCKDDDGGVKKITIDREFTLYCSCPGGSLSSTQAGSDKSIVVADFSDYEKTKAAGLKEWPIGTFFDTSSWGCWGNCSGESMISNGGYVVFEGTGENFRGGIAKSKLTLIWD